MRTRSSSNLPVVSSNPSTSNPNHHNHRRLKQPFIPEESPVDTMASQRTMAELLRAPTEGYAEAIVVPLFLLINSSSSTDRYKDLLRACPHHDFIELHQLDTFYNALNPADQDSLNVAAGGNLLERRTQDVLTIIENKSKIAKLTHAVNQQTSVVTTVMTAILKQFQATPPPASVKAVEEIVLLTVVLIRITSVSPSVATLSQNFGIISTDTFSKPQLITIRKKLGLLKLISTRMTLELVNRVICTPAGIARDVFVPVGNFTFPADFVIVDYESDPRVPFILGRPFLWTARALIDVHGKEMILYDDDERLTLNMRHDTSSCSNQPQKESINLINIFNNSSEDFLEDLFSNQPIGNPTFLSNPELTLSEVNDDIFDSEGGNVLLENFLDLDSTKDLHPLLHDNPLSCSTTYSSSNPLLEEFVDELALITFPSKYDDDLQFDFVDSMPEMFTDEHALDYSSPSIFDEYDDDFLEVKSDTKNVYDDPFDSKGEKIKESKLLINKLDIPCDFLPLSEYDSFISQDFSRVDALPSTNNEDKLFNPGILIQEKTFEIITRVVQDKKPATSNASLMLEDFDPPLYEPLFFKEVPKSNMLLLFYLKMRKKFSNQGFTLLKKFILLLSLNYLIKAIKFSKSTKFSKAR
nr:hypothetical protein [Tanacetum cinerariifolium]